MRELNTVRIVYIKHNSKYNEKSFGFVIYKEKIFLAGAGGRFGLGMAVYARAISGMSDLYACIRVILNYIK